MSSSRIQVGLPLEKSRASRRAGWNWSSHPSARSRQEDASRPKSLRPQAQAGDAIAAPETARPLPELAAEPLPLLPFFHFLLLTALMLITILLVWGMVRSNHLSVALSYDISSLTQKKLGLLEDNRQLKTELTSLASLDQLEEAARQTLGLITPNQGQIVVLE